MVDERELEWIKRKKMMEFMKDALKHGETRLEVPAEPIVVTDENFDEVVGSYPLVVVDFWAEWCPPCKVIAPVVEELAREYAGKVVFLKLNVDENPVTPAKYGIMSIPTLLIFKDGKPVDAIVGAYPRKVIEVRIRRYL